MNPNDHDELLSFYKSERLPLSSRLAVRDDVFANDMEEESISRAEKLSVFFATLCVIDLFGVFPIVALPKAIISCGFYGIPLLLFVITLQIYTGVILGRCWIIAEKLDPTIIRKNRYPYAAVAELTYGKYMSLFVTVLLDVTVFGGGIPNLLVSSQNLQLFGLRISDGNFDFSFCLWLIIIGVFLCPIMWLGSPKNMKELASVSVVIISSVTLLTWYCIWSDMTFSKSVDENDEETTEMFHGFNIGIPSFGSLLKAYGIIAFQFDIHPMLMTIEVDMKEKHKIGKAVTLGLIITVLLSIMTTAFATYRYGMWTTPNVLEILPRSWPLYAAILLVTIQLCISSAIGNSALFQHIEGMLRLPRDFTLKRCIIRSILVGLAVLIGELLPRFELVMGIIGGTLTGPLIFILPPLLYRKITKLEEIYDHQVRIMILANNETDQQQNPIDPYPDHVAEYGTIRYRYASVRHSQLRKIARRVKRYCQKLYSDCFLSILVVVFGLVATFVTTYFNILNVADSVQFWSPCMTNVNYSMIDL